MEIETIVGEPLREAQRLGVPAPTLAFVYSILKALQMRTKQRKGLVELPPMKEYRGNNASDQIQANGV